MTQVQLDELKRLEQEKPDLETILGSNAAQAITMESYYESRMLMHAFKKAREKAGMTLADVSRRTGMQLTAISRLENGRATNPSLDTLIRLAQALRLRLSFSLTSDDNVPAIRGNRQKALVG